MGAEFQAVIDEFAGLILDGDFDEQLDYLLRQIKQRKELILSRALTVGARIRISGDCRPKYLCYARGQVIGILGDKYRIRLDRQIGRFSQEITVPAGLLVPE
jgi:hypothetical protein